MGRRQRPGPEAGATGGTGPVRTCVGCRRSAAQAELLRVVAVEGRVVADPRRRAAGRGAYLHHDPACLELAVRRRAFARALRIPQPDSSGLAVGPETG